MSEDGRLLPIVDAWLRRHWRADAQAPQPEDGLKPAIVITGGSAGIGLAIAARFARPGRRVVLVARGEAGLAAAAAGLVGTGADVVTLPLDLRAPDAAERLVAAVGRQGCYIDILVNNAGIGLCSPFTSQAPGDLVSLLDLNVRALTLLTRAALPGMCRRGRGGILNIASLGGFMPGPYQAAYYASKAYVLSLTEAIAHEVAGQGVRVSCVAPGPVDTAFHAAMNAEAAVYRHLIPAASAASVAGSAYRGFLLGHRVIMPGVLGWPLALTSRVIPHRVLIPIVGWLLRPRD